jgi:alkylation response protein AidB-like acyl-CoA dehydrogenase
MNLDFTPEENAFREEVRAFISENYPPSCARRRTRAGADQGRVPDVAQGAGQEGLGGAVVAEGAGRHRLDAHAEVHLVRGDGAGRLPADPAVRPAMLAPVLYTFGTDEQKQRFLPGIYNGDVWWCQGYSEPGAGSDLASLKCKAERITADDGKEYYIVNGQKTWTTLGQHADWGFFLVRTDPDAKPQAGISFLLIDMKTPGHRGPADHHPGGRHEVNDVFLDNVKVPVENRIFHENQGWTCAKALLAHERSGIAGVARSKRNLEKLRTIAGTERSDTGSALLATRSSAQGGRAGDRPDGLEFTELRTLAGESSGKGPGPESSILKIKGTEIQQRLQSWRWRRWATTARRSCATWRRTNLPVGPDYAEGLAGDMFNGRKTSIYGGSNEIQRNIIAKAVLGL